MEWLVNSTPAEWTSYSTPVRYSIPTGQVGQAGRAQIIEAVEKGLLPDKIMLNTHPQRWDDRLVPWVKELVWQNVKNVIKRAMLAYWNTGIKANTGMLECWN